MTNGIQLKPLLSAREIALETCVALGAVWYVRERPVPPVAAGHVVLLDTIRSPFVAGHQECAEKHTATVEALVVLLNGATAVQAHFQVVSTYGQEVAMWDAMKREASALIGKKWERVALNIGAAIETAFAGFETIDWKGDPPKANNDGWDAMWLAGLIGAVATTCPALTPQAITWDIPFALVGHLAACAQHGADIHREWDMGNLEDQAKAMAEAEKKNR